MRGLQCYIRGVGGAALALALTGPSFSVDSAEPSLSTSIGYPSSSRNDNSIPPYSVLPSSPAIAAPTANENAAHTLRAKALLLHLGYDVGSLDSMATARFKAAVLYFQQDQELPKTGELDPQTYKRLMEIGQ